MSDLEGKLWALSGIAIDADDGFTRLNAPARALIEDAARALSAKGSIEPDEALVEKVARALCDDTLKRWRSPIALQREPWKEFEPAARAVVAIVLASLKPL